MKQKTIYACYEEIRQREISELKRALRNIGGEYTFPECDAPTVMCNLKYEGPHDVRILTARLNADGKPQITGQPVYNTGPADSYGDEQDIPLRDIAYSHVEFITGSIPSEN